MKIRLRIEPFIVNNFIRSKSYSFDMVGVDGDPSLGKVSGTKAKEFLSLFLSKYGEILGWEDLGETITITYDLKRKYFNLLKTVLRLGGKSKLWIKFLENISNLNRKILRSWIIEETNKEIIFRNL